MSFQIIPQEQSSFGKILTGAAKGFAEQAPKEAENYRLAQGLERLGKQSNLTPLDFATKAYGTYGITPQMVDSLGQLARYQNKSRGYSQGNGDVNQGGGNQQEPELAREDIKNYRPNQSANANLRDVNFGNKNPNQFVQEPELGRPQIVDTNPTRSNAQVAKPWTTERHNREVANILAQFPGTEINEARAIAKENEARDLARPAAEREADEYKEKVRDATDKKFIDQLGTRLQKNKEGLFEDITGDNLIDMQEGLRNEIVENPNESIDNIVSKWTKKALEFARTKKELDVLANRGSIYKLIDNENTYNKLKTYQKIYADANNLNEFYNKLRNDFEMTDQGAALIAYPKSEKASNFVNQAKPFTPKNVNGGSSYLASQISKNITSDDSILAIARDLQTKNPLFNQVEFFDYLTNNLENLPLNDRQKREVAQGASKVPMNWADFFILPSRRK